MNIKEAYNQLTPDDTSFWNWYNITNKLGNKLEFGGNLTTNNFELAVRYNNIRIGIEHNKSISFDDFYQYIETPSARSSSINLFKSVDDFLEYVENTDFSTIKIDIIPIYTTVLSHYEIKII